jgi:hypothetical protein
MEYAVENYTAELRKALAGIAAGRLAPLNFFMVTLANRILGLCTLLQQSDRDAFAAGLSKAGNARAEFLMLAHQGLEAPAKYLCASKNIGFSAALAAGDLKAARRIAELSPHSHFSDIEYEDDFLFFHFMHRSLLEPENHEALNRLLARWDVVLEGGDSGYRDVCRSLLRTNREFEEGFDSLIHFRQIQLNEYKERISCDREMFAAEGQIFVEGLAVLRIAELKGLKISGEYPLIPEISRVPLGTPLPAEDAWKRM